MSLKMPLNYSMLEKHSAKENSSIAATATIGGIDQRKFVVDLVKIDFKIK